LRPDLYWRVKTASGRKELYSPRRIVKSTATAWRNTPGLKGIVVFIFFLPNPNPGTKFFYGFWVPTVERAVEG